MKKYNYQRYDYSFLMLKETWKPIGKLYYMDYEPIRDREGTWTMSLTPPASITSTVTAPPIQVAISTYDDFVKAYTTASNEINNRSKRGTANYTITSASVYRGIKNAETRKISKEHFFARRNFFKNLRNSKHGKKI